MRSSPESRPAPLESRQTRRKSRWRRRSSPQRRAPPDAGARWSGAAVRAGCRRTSHRAAEARCSGGCLPPRASARPAHGHDNRSRHGEARAQRRHERPVRVVALDRNDAIPVVRCREGEIDASRGRAHLEASNPAPLTEARNRYLCGRRTRSPFEDGAHLRGDLADRRLRELARVEPTLDPEGRRGLREERRNL